MKQKGLRKLVSMILAVVMVLAMSITGFAETYSITISNTTKDESYYAYQIFEATYVDGYEQDSSTGIAYTIKSDSAWYEAVRSSELFTLTKISTDEYDVTTYEVKAKSADITVQNITEWAANAVETYEIQADAGKEKNGTGSSVTLSVSNAGYYYVTSSLGTTVTLTSAAPRAEIIDKNQTPGGKLDKVASESNAQIGDTIEYTITSNVPAYDGETKITNYTFTDTLPNGLTPLNDDVSSITVAIKDASGETVETDSAVTIKYEGNSVYGYKIIVSYDPTEITNYPADATIEIKYTLVVNASATYENKNSVKQTWTGNSKGTTDEVIVYTYGLNLEKVDGKKNGDGSYNELTGAKFKLYTSDISEKAITFSYENGTYTVDPEGTVTEIKAGYATIFGLDSDVTYYLEEIKAPDGYNLLESRVAVEAGAQKEQIPDGVQITYPLEQIENNSGSTLPSTGGMGTTIFYIVGGVLVLGAAVLFVTKKRLGNEN